MSAKSIEMNTFDELRQHLAQTFFAVRDGTLKPGAAKEMNNSIGQMIKSTKVQIEHAKLAGVKPKIAMMD